MMKIAATLVVSALTALTFTGCQSTAKQHNGTIGYQVESSTENSAVIAYTLAGRKNQNVSENKLQSACQKVLGNSKTYTISILSINEIANPVQDVEYGRQIGNSRATIGLSNTPGLHNNEDYATHQSLDARPSTLSIVRYTCS